MMIIRYNNYTVIINLKLYYCDIGYQISVISDMNPSVS